MEELMENNEYVIKLKDCDIYFSHNHLLMLTERQRKIIELRFLFNEDNKNTLEKVGKLIGSIRNKDVPINRERVRQIQNNAIRRLLNKNRHNKVIFHYHDFKKWQQKNGETL